MPAQKFAKQKIEDAVAGVLTGDLQKNALDFIAFLRENKISLSQAYADTWRAAYKGKAAGVVILQNKGLNISLRGDYSSRYENILINDKMKNSLEKNLWVKPCQYCNKACYDGITASLFGKEFTKICKHMLNTTYFLITDADAVECARLIIQKRCDDIEV